MHTRIAVNIAIKGLPGRVGGHHGHRAVAEMQGELHNNIGSVVHRLQGQDIGARFVKGISHVQRGVRKISKQPRFSAVDPDGRFTASRALGGMLQYMRERVEKDLGGGLKYHINQVAIYIEFVAAQQLVIDRGSHHGDAANNVLKLDIFAKVAENRLFVGTGMYMQVRVTGKERLGNKSGCWRE